MKLRRQAAEALRAAYEREMTDRAVILSPVTASDGCGAPVHEWTESEPTPCLFSHLSASEQARLELTQSESVARVRFPVGTTLTRLDRVRITRVGWCTPDEPMEYAVNGDPREPVGYVAAELKQVTA